MDGSVPQVSDAGLSQGSAVAGSSHIAASAAVGSFAAPAPMLVELKSFLSNELCSFEEELKRQNDESINSAVKKRRLENSARHSFKSKGNDEQYIHEEKIATCFGNAIQALHSGEVSNTLEEGKNLVAMHLKHIVLADLHGWDFATEYKQIPIAEDEFDEKRIRKVLKDVESPKEKKKLEKAKKASKFKLESRRLAPRFTNDVPASFSSMSGCYLCGKPGHFWRSCYRSRNLPARTAIPATLGNASTVGPVAHAANHYVNHSRIQVTPGPVLLISICLS